MSTHNYLKQKKRRHFHIYLFDFFGTKNVSIQDLETGQIFDLQDNTRQHLNKYNSSPKDKYRLFFFIISFMNFSKNSIYYIFPFLCIGKEMPC